MCLISQGHTLRCNNYIINLPFSLNNLPPPLNVTPPAGPSTLVTQSYTCQVFIASTIWTCVHRFNDVNVEASTYTLLGVRIFPDTMTITDPNTVTFTWPTAQAGTAVIFHAAPLTFAITQPNAVLQNPTGSQVISTWPLLISSPTSFSFLLGLPTKTDPVTPAPGEAWVNLGLLKFEDNAVSPAKHVVSTSLPGTCSAGQVVNAITADAVPGCIPFSLALTALTTLGDTLSVNSTPALTRIPGNTTATKLFFTQTGTGSVSALPGWNPIVAGDVPQINLATSGAGGVGGLLPIANTCPGTTGASSTTFLRGDCTWSNPSGGVVAVFANQTISGQSIPASTPTAVVAKAITMPASGCPCRVFMSYSVWSTTITSGTGYDLWISDGTNTMAPFSTGASNGSGGSTGMSYSGFSPVTYANGVTVTFTLMEEGDHSIIIQAGKIVAGSVAPWTLQLAVFQSN
jgi:hypothetical protein